MKSNRFNKSLLIGITALSLVLVLMMGTASAKSLYVIKDLNDSSPIRAYDIQDSPTFLLFQIDSPRIRDNGVGLAVVTWFDTATQDTEAVLFLTFKGSNVLDVVKADDLTVLDTVTAPGARNLSGIAFDHEKQKFYTIDRDQKGLYIYSWDGPTYSLTYDGIVNLPEVFATFDLDLDQLNNQLYVGDITTDVKIFNTDDWSFAGSVPVSQEVMGVAVDPELGLVYTGNAYSGSPGWLCKYDMNTDVESTVSIPVLTGVTSDNPDFPNKCVHSRLFLVVCAS